MRPTGIALLLTSALAQAVETGPVQVLSVSDGDTITVAGSVGGITVAQPVRLLWIDTPETSDNSHGGKMPEGFDASAAMREWIPDGSAVRLWLVAALGEVRTATGPVARSVGSS